MRSVDYIAVHNSATPASMDIGAEEIDVWHRQRGWLGIGYHYVIRRDGTLETGRPEEQPGAHVRGFNQRSIGIVLVGGTKPDAKTPETNFTEEQYITLRILIDDLKARYPDATVQGHRDFPRVHKACPGFDAGHWYDTGEVVE